MHSPAPHAALRRIAAAAILTVAAACSTATSVSERGPVDAAVGTPFSLRVGQRADVDAAAPAGPLRVTFVGVTSDSRCAADVQCVWEGDARVALRLEHGSVAADTAAHTSGRFTPPPELAGYRVTVEALAPQTRTDRPIPPGDYVVTLRVTKTG